MRSFVIFNLISWFLFSAPSFGGSLCVEVVSDESIEPLEPMVRHPIQIKLQRVSAQREHASSRTLEELTAMMNLHFGRADNIGAGGQGSIFSVGEPATEDQMVFKVSADRSVVIRDAVITRYLRDQFLHSNRPLTEPIPFLDIQLRPESLDFMQMPLVVTTLYDRIKSFGPQEIDAATKTILRMASILSFVHSQGIIHRDANLGNFFELANGHLVLGDFALASPEGEYLPGEGLGTFSGNRNYAPYSQFEGQLPSPAMDTYALRVGAHSLLIGYVINDNELLTNHAVLRRRLHPESSLKIRTFAASPHSFAKEIPAAISAAVWFPSRTVAEFESLFQSAVAHTSAGTADLFFKEVFAPKFRQLIRENPARAADIFLSADEIYQAYLDGNLPFVEEEELFWLGCGEVYLAEKAPGPKFFYDGFHPIRVKLAI